GYLDIMSREVNAHGGTIDKFIGDAVMAFWGAPTTNENHARDACRAALACQRALRRSGLTDDQGRPLKIRIGINSGNMLVGKIGCEGGLNYTVIGDAVNVASRLEGVNKEYGSEIIIGEETRRMAGDAVHVRELDRLMVYGRQGGLRIYELIGLATGASETPSWVALYESGLAAYRGRNFAAALGFFQMLLAVREWDRPARVMIERCRTFLKAPPGEDWEATAALQAKYRMSRKSDRRFSNKDMRHRKPVQEMLTMPSENPAKRRVVISGAGFGGLPAAKALANPAFDVPVSDRHNYHLFQPLLYQ